MMLRRTTYVIAAVVAVFAVLTLMFRFALSQIGDYEEEIVTRLSAMVGAEVRIGTIEIALSGIEPVVELSQIHVAASDDTGSGLHVGRLHLELDLWASLFSGQAKFSDFRILDTDFLVVTDAEGHSRVAGFLPLPMGFATQDGSPAAGFSFHLERATIRWRNEQAGSDYEFENVGAAFESEDGRLRFAVTAALPAALGQVLHIAADLDDGLQAGRVYVRADGARLAQWAHLAGSPDAAAGVFSGELWSDWRDGDLQRLDGAFDCTDCVMAAASGPVSAQTRLSWEARANGWRLGLLDFAWASPTLTPGVLIDHSDIAIEYFEGGSRLVLRVAAIDKDLLRVAADAALPLLQKERVNILAGQGSAALSAVVAHPGFAPPAFPETTQLTASDWRRRAQNKLQFALEYAFEYAGHLLAPAAVQAGQLDVALKGVAAELPGWSEQTFDFDEVSASVRYGAGGVRVEDLSLRVGDARLSGGLVWRDGATPTVGAALALVDLPLASVKRWLPRAGLKPLLAAWLEQAFVAGVLKSARVEFDGAPSSFPFKDGGGRFHAEGEVVGATLNYRRNRQPLRDVNARVVVDDQSLSVEASALRYYDLQSQSARIVVKDLTLPLIEVNATGEGPLASVFAYLKDAQLVNPDSVVMHSLKPGGGARLDVSVKAPLSKEVAQAVTVEGALSFDGGSLRVTPLDLEFSEIAGVLNFDRRGGSAQSLTAKLGGVAVSAAAKPARDGATMLTLKGRPEVAQLFDLSKTPLSGAVRGAAPWQAEVLIPGLRTGAEYELKMVLASSLEGVAVTLPAPFAKAADERRDFSADIVLGAKSEYVLSYGGDIRAALIKDAQTPWGYLHFGAAAPPPLERGHFSVGGTIEQAVELDDWFGLMDADADPDLYPDRMDLSFAELRRGGELLGEATVALKLDSDGRRLQIDAPWAQGWFFIPDAGGAAAGGVAAGGAVFAKMEKLFLPQAASTVSGTGFDPANVPPLELEVADFRRGDLQVSNLQLLTEPTDGGMKVGRLAFEAGDVLVMMSGRWLFDGQAHRSQFELEMNGRDYGRMLQQLDVPGSLKRGDGSLFGRVAWDDKPAGFALAKLKGDVRVKLTDGVVEKANPGIGRLLGLFSVGHIVQRLSLDFRDILETGLSFDTLEGNLNFRDGVMHTEDFIIAGPALAMTVSGDNQIAEERYDQRIDVVPNLSSGLPVAGALLGGPLAAAAVYLVDRLTGFGSRMDKVVTLRYHLHGSWDDPQVDFEGAPETGQGPGKLKKLLKKVIP